MHDQEHLFLRTSASVQEIAGLLRGLFELEPIPNSAGAGPDEIGLRGPARTAEAVVGYVVQQNGYAMVDPEPDEVQAIDDYPVEITVWLGKDEGTQRQESRLTFDRLVEAWPTVPMLLCHDISLMIAAYVPGRGVHEFPPATTIDVPDEHLWRDWI